MKRIFLTLLAIVSLHLALTPKSIMCGRKKQTVHQLARDKRCANGVSSLQ